MLPPTRPPSAFRVPHSLRAFCAKGGQLLILAAAFAFVAASQQKSPTPNITDALAARNYRIVDLTHPLAAHYPAWPGDNTPFTAELNATIEKNGYFTRRVTFLEHFGTHLDAPAHFIAGQPTIEQIPPEKFFAPAVVLDVTVDAETNSNHQVPASTIHEWENRNGRIPVGSIVLLRTGWAAFWPREGRYRHQDSQGVMHFPGFSVEAVKALIERKVIALGVDTLSIDHGASKDFAAHKISHAAGLYHLENLADLGALPEKGAFLIVAPIKLEGGSGGPARVFALVP